MNSTLYLFVTKLNDSINEHDSTGEIRCKQITNHLNQSIAQSESNAF